jgi:hypothetical protein
VFVKAGSLDDPDWVKPTHQSWISKAVPWAKIDEDLPSFPRGRLPGKSAQGNA